MPHVLRELFAAAGERMEDHLDLVRLDSCCRYFWTDGTVIDEDAAFWSQPEVARFLEYARGIYELSGEAYLNRPPGDFWRAFTPRNWPKLRHLGKVATTRTLADEVERRISDPHLRQIFLRFATYNGSSPYLTPATFNIIPYVEAEFGAWYVRGGMAKIAEALAALAQRNGVTFRFNTTATDWDGTEATAQDGARSRADFLVCNADVLGARRPDFSPGSITPRRAREFALLRNRFPLRDSFCFSACADAIRAWAITIFSFPIITAKSFRRSTNRKSVRPSRRFTSRSVRGPIRIMRRTVTTIILFWSMRPRAIRSNRGRNPR